MPQRPLPLGESYLEYTLRKQLFWRWAGFLSIALVISVLCFTLLACQNLPFSAAKTPLQRAYAVYGTFVVAEEQAATLKQSSTLPPAVIHALAQADRIAKPSADALLNAVLDVTQATQQLKAGSGTPEKLAIAQAQLNTWIPKAEADVTSLVKAVEQKP